MRRRLRCGTAARASVSSASLGVASDSGSPPDRITSSMLASARDQRRPPRASRRRPRFPRRRGSGGGSSSGSAPRSCRWRPAGRGRGTCGSRRAPALAAPSPTASRLKPGIGRIFVVQRQHLAQQRVVAGRRGACARRSRAAPAAGTARPPRRRRAGAARPARAAPAVRAGRARPRATAVASAGGGAAAQGRAAWGRGLRVSWRTGFPCAAAVGPGATARHSSLAARSRRGRHRHLFT